MVYNYTLNRQKNLKNLTETNFDVLVIGGGITGAGIAWDASLRGLKVAIIDKGDFGSGTSSSSSKLVHAGLRYIAYGNFKLVREASRERKWILEHCSHLAKPIPFLIPTYKKGKHNSFQLKLVGLLYDFLACYKNTHNHTILSKKEVLSLFPEIKSEPLLRGLYYWDGIMDDARITLETILSALENGVVAINYLKALSFTVEKDKKNSEIIKEIKVEDMINGNVISIKAKVIINAIGIWTDELLKELNGYNKLLHLTKGIHIITKRIVKDDVVLVITSTDNRYMYVIPFRKDYTLIGTTDTNYIDNLDHIDVTQKDIDYVISAVNNDLPGVLSKNDVISAYSGIRPLIFSKKAKKEEAMSRSFKIVKVKSNLLAVIGGKYTIYRHMAEKTVDKIIKILKLKQKNYKCKTKNTNIHGSNGFEEIKKNWKIIIRKIIKKYKLDNDISEHIVNTYGSSYQEILQYLEKKSMQERIIEGHPFIVAEIFHSVEKEMCLTLSDFMMRRTQLQYLEHQGLDCAEKVADIMGNILKWDNKEKKSQYMNYKKELVYNP